MHAGAGDLAVRLNSTIATTRPAGTVAASSVLIRVSKVARRPRAPLLRSRTRRSPATTLREDGGGIFDRLRFPPELDDRLRNTVTPLADRRPARVLTCSPTGQPSRSATACSARLRGGAVKDPAEHEPGGRERSSARSQTTAGRRRPSCRRRPARRSTRVSRTRSRPNSAARPARSTVRPANAADGTDIGAVEIEADPVQPGPEPEPEPEPDPRRFPARRPSSASASR